MSKNSTFNKAISDLFELLKEAPAPAVAPPKPSTKPQTPTRPSPSKPSTPRPGLPRPGLKPIPKAETTPEDKKQNYLRAALKARGK